MEQQIGARRSSVHFGAFFLVVAAVAISAGCNLLPSEPTASDWEPPGGPARALVARAPEPVCAERTPVRQALFGDLHVHTGFSMDARTRDLTLTPDDAYRFATGETVALPPLHADGTGTVNVTIDRPLDFAAVTDHAEWIGEVSLCTRPGSPAWDTKSCRQYRGEEEGWLPWILGFKGRIGRMFGLMTLSGRNEEVCGEGASLCRAELLSRWQETQTAAERWDDPSAACRFTTFHAYEYSASPDRSKLHRNVIFRNEIVPELPISWVDHPQREDLWRALRERCLDTDTGCDVMTIPHNPNLSNGRLFAVDYRDLPLAEQRERAALRGKMDRLVEMMQAKGESECAPGLFGVRGDEDELCGFEKIRGLGDDRPEDCEEGTGKGALADWGCESRLDYARYALVEGLREYERIGVNPYAFGMIGSTDTHNASPGAVEEPSFFGTRGEESINIEARLTPANGTRMMNEFYRNPGGLVGVWAEENSRESLFGAFRRRETFATSGPRIRPRFFGGWGLPSGLCGGADLVARADAAGVPMGGELGPRPDGAVPTFVAQAVRDPGSVAHEGTALQRIQIIKAWVGTDGAFHQRIVDVAGERDPSATVDLATCRPRGAGHDVLCGQWRDVDFDPSRPTVYYARVLENPSCRWTWHQCLSLPADRRPAACSMEDVPKVIQERAWTSPVFYLPDAGAGAA